MSWQERLRDLGDRLTEGQITTDDYRRLSEEILAEADAEAAAETQPAATRPTETQPEETPPTEVQADGDKPKVHIPVSAAWEAPSGEMTQIVGTRDETTVVNTSIADKLEPDDPVT
jgi:hypothetical protein